MYRPNQNHKDTQVVPPFHTLCRHPWLTYIVQIQTSAHTNFELWMRAADLALVPRTLRGAKIRKTCFLVSSFPVPATSQAGKQTGVCQNRIPNSEIRNVFQSTSNRSLYNHHYLYGSVAGCLKNVWDLGTTRVGKGTVFWLCFWGLPGKIWIKRLLKIGLVRSEGVLVSFV